MKKSAGLLNWDVFVAEPIPMVLNDFAPGMTTRMWSPTSATLIYGKKEAILVDTLMTADQAFALADWVAEHKRTLTAIYITHGHGDHFFGAAIIKNRFPGARVVSRPEAIEVMKKQSSPQWLDSFWRKRFPGQIPQQLMVAEPLLGNTLLLEGNDLVSIPLGHTDTEKTSCLHIPSIGLVVAGDAAYNDVHLYLGESNQSLRQEWLGAIDIMSALSPSAVVAGHKRPGSPDDPDILDRTRQYILDFDRIVETTKTALELFDGMMRLHPNRDNAGALWASARMLKE